MSLPPTLYKDPGVQLESKPLVDEQYQAAMSSFIVVCSDVVIVDRDQRMLYLPRRIIRPMIGPWFIGGRRRRGESAKAAARRHFKSDTNLDLPELRFDFLRMNEYLLIDREQEPQHLGTHALASVFCVELEEKERTFAAKHLSKEYAFSCGLQPYDHPRLKAGTQGTQFQALSDSFQQLFP